MDCFSDELIERIQDYFRKHYGYELSQDEAVNSLHSLAELYLAWQDILKAEPDDERGGAAV